MNVTNKKIKVLGNIHKMTHESTLLRGVKAWRLRGNKKQTLMGFRGDLARKDPKN
jgi:hypothetical protein